MIDNIGISIYPDSKGLTVITFDITIDIVKYNWEVHVDPNILKTISPSAYLTENQNIIINDIQTKEYIWVNSPHTREIIDEFGQTVIVDIDKSEVVSPNYPSIDKIISDLCKQTEAHIDSKMPQWRLNRWRRYFDLYTKISGGGTLNEIEQYEYDCFPDPGETHEICQAYVSLALKWCADCITAHKNALVALSQATTTTQIEAAKNVSYPTWPI